MNRSPGLQLRQVRRRKKTLIAPGWSPALQFRGSWSLCRRESERKISMNRKAQIVGVSELELRIRPGGMPRLNSSAARQARPAHFGPTTEQR